MGAAFRMDVAGKCRSHFQCLGISRRLRAGAELTSFHFDNVAPVGTKYSESGISRTYRTSTKIIRHVQGTDTTG